MIYWLVAVGVLLGAASFFTKANGKVALGLLGAEVIAFLLIFTGG